MSFIHEYSISYCYNMTLELKEDLTENIPSQAVVNFAPVNAQWQMRKHQLNKGGASLLPKLGAVNVGVTLTHLGPPQGDFVIGDHGISQRLAWGYLFIIS